MADNQPTGVPSDGDEAEARGARDYEQAATGVPSDEELKSAIGVMPGPMGYEQSWFMVLKEVRDRTVAAKDEEYSKAISISGIKQMKYDHKQRCTQLQARVSELEAELKREGLGNNNVGRKNQLIWWLTRSLARISARLSTIRK
jgi:hypothetical protein